MASVLHLLKAPDAGHARATIMENAAVGDRVTVVLLPGAGTSEFPPGVAVHRVPDDLSYERLLELIFEADQVITW